MSEYKPRPMTAERMRKIMSAFKISKRELARHSGYTDRTISSYYYGERVVSERLARSLVALSGSAALAAADEARRSVSTRPWYEGLIGALSDMGRLAAKSGLKDLQIHRSAVASMCRSCEPDGFCHQSDCALRPVSPYPLAGRR